MIIATGLVKKSRVTRWCCECTTIILKGSYVRWAYGRAHRGDPAYRIYAHPQCVPHWKEHEPQA